MGLSFDGNGKYIGWSTLFKYSSLGTIQASEYLPYPKKMLYNKANKGYNLTDYKNIKRKLEEDIRMWQRELNQETTTEDRKLELNDNIQKAYEELNASGLDINENINVILSYLNIIQDLTNKIREINTSLRKASAKDREDLLYTRNLLFLQEDDYEIKRIGALAKLLNNINSISSDFRQRGGKISANLYYTILDGDKIVQLLREHEFTNIPLGLLADANKNFISSHILNTVLDLSNMVRAYSPIEMEDFRDASSLSAKGELASKMTLLNPATKMLMLYSNMTGKNVIGIAANGIKASFMWNYYLNDIIRNNPTNEDLNYAIFDFKLSRVVGRANNNIQEVTINTLPDINFSLVDPYIKDRLGNKLKGPLPVDLMSSQVLSAATDNAKELILAKVNAGNKLAKMYLFLISLGVDVRDIVKFMTSDTASFIDQITEENIFDKSNIAIQDAIEMAKGNFNPYIKKYGKAIIEELRDIYSDYGLGTKEKRDDAILDAEEFKNILEGADEFSRFGQLLGLNQGLATSESDLRNMMQKILNIMLSRAKEVQGIPKEIMDKILVPIDVTRWASDLKYRDELKELYNHIKKCINIFDIFDRIKLFDAIREILDSVITIDNNLTIKTKAYIKLLDRAKQDNVSMSDLYKTRLLKSIDNAIISKFINTIEVSIPIAKGGKYLTADADIMLYTIDGKLKLDSKNSIASFKYIFENVIVPNLLKGIILNYVNGQVIETQYPEIKSNPFIRGLLKSSYRDVPLYKANLNMLTIEDSTESLRKFLLYTKGLLELSDKYINGTSVLDLFILYNLIVNKNLYGADRLTTLFDKIVTSDLSTLLLLYFKYLGDLDFFGEVMLDTEDTKSDDLKSSLYKELESKDLLLKISYKDSLISAANIVSSTIGLRDPYIKVNTEQGVVLMHKNGKGYELERGIILQRKGETPNLYLDRINNYNSYFTLGENLSEVLTNLIREITSLGKNALDYINDFILRGILTINKVCE